MEIATFWNEQHPLSAQSTELTNTLVPSSGHCATVEGELLRASNRIGYDWYNNGWGCNNWSGAVCFIQQHMSFLPINTDQRQLLTRELKYVYDYSHGEPCRLDYDGRTCEAVTNIQAIIVQGILDRDGAYHANNDDDMFNYQEHDYDYQNDNQIDDEEDEY